MPHKQKKFDRFFHAFSLSFPRAKEAEKNGYLIESVILMVAHIDALLRVLIYQKRQLNQKTTRIKDDALFVQKHNDKNYPYHSERIIINNAYRTEKVIDKKTKDSLLNYLNKRNSFIHRIFLGNWQYNKIKKLIKEGETLIDKLQVKAERHAQKQEKGGLLKGPVFRKTIEKSDEEQIQKTILKYFS